MSEEPLYAIPWGDTECRGMRAFALTIEVIGIISSVQKNSGDRRSRRPGGYSGVTLI